MTAESALVVESEVEVTDATLSNANASDMLGKNSVLESTTTASGSAAMPLAAASRVGGGAAAAPMDDTQAKLEQAFAMALDEEVEVTGGAGGEAAEVEVETRAFASSSSSSSSSSAAGGFTAMAPAAPAPAKPKTIGLGLGLGLGLGGGMKPKVATTAPLKMAAKTTSTASSAAAAAREQPVKKKASGASKPKETGSSGTAAAAVDPNAKPLSAFQLYAKEQRAAVKAQLEAAAAAAAAATNDGGAGGDDAGTTGGTSGTTKTTLADVNKALKAHWDALEEGEKAAYNAQHEALMSEWETSGKKALYEQAEAVKKAAKKAAKEKEQQAQQQAEQQEGEMGGGEAAAAMAVDDGGAEAEVAAGAEGEAVVEQQAAAPKKKRGGLLGITLGAKAKSTSGASAGTTATSITGVEKKAKKQLGAGLAIRASSSSSAADSALAMKKKSSGSSKKTTTGAEGDAATGDNDKRAKTKKAPGPKSAFFLFSDAKRSEVKAVIMKEMKDSGAREGASKEKNDDDDEGEAAPADDEGGEDGGSSNRFTAMRQAMGKKKAASAATSEQPTVPVTEVAKRVGALWKALTADERAVWEAKAEKAKEEFYRLHPHLLAEAEERRKNKKAAKKSSSKGAEEDGFAGAGGKKKQKKQAKKAGDDDDSSSNSDNNEEADHSNKKAKKGKGSKKGGSKKHRRRGGSDDDSSSSDGSGSESYDSDDVIIVKDARKEKIEQAKAKGYDKKVTITKDGFLVGAVELGEEGRVPRDTGTMKFDQCRINEGDDAVFIIPAYEDLVANDEENAIEVSNMIRAGLVDPKQVALAFNGSTGATSSSDGSSSGSAMVIGGGAANSKLLERFYKANKAGMVFGRVVSIVGVLQAAREKGIPLPSRHHGSKYQGDSDDDEEDESEEEEERADGKSGGSKKGASKKAAATGGADDDDLDSVFAAAFDGDGKGSNKGKKKTFGGDNATSVSNASSRRTAINAIPSDTGKGWKLVTLRIQPKLTASCGAEMDESEDDEDNESEEEDGGSNASSRSCKGKKDLLTVLWLSPSDDRCVTYSMLNRAGYNASVARDLKPGTQVRAMFGLAGQPGKGEWLEGRIYANASRKEDKERGWTSCEYQSVKCIWYEQDLAHPDKWAIELYQTDNTLSPWEIVTDNLPYVPQQNKALFVQESSAFKHTSPVNLIRFLMETESGKLFANPVNKKENPSYYARFKNDGSGCEPDLCLQVMMQKALAGEYTDTAPQQEMSSSSSSSSSSAADGLDAAFDQAFATAAEKEKDKGYESSFSQYDPSSTSNGKSSKRGSGKSKTGPNTAKLWGHFITLIKRAKTFNPSERFEWVLADELEYLVRKCRKYYKPILGAAGSSTSAGGAGAGGYKSGYGVAGSASAASNRSGGGGASARSAKSGTGAASAQSGVGVGKKRKHSAMASAASARSSASFGLAAGAAASSMDVGDDDNEALLGPAPVAAPAAAMGMTMMSPRPSKKAKKMVEAEQAVVEEEAMAASAAAFPAAAMAIVEEQEVEREAAAVEAAPSDELLFSAAGVEVEEEEVVM
jgi:HMG (high mobility group) box